MIFNNEQETESLDTTVMIDFFSMLLDSTKTEIVELSSSTLNSYVSVPLKNVFAISLDVAKTVGVAHRVFSKYGGSESVAGDVHESENRTLQFTS